MPYPLIMFIELLPVESTNSFSGLVMLNADTPIPTLPVTITLPLEINPFFITNSEAILFYPSLSRLNN